MVKVRCRTNLDIHPSERWPKYLPERPVEGDIIEAVSGLQLKVVRVCFQPIRTNDNFEKLNEVNINDWELVVELNVKFGTVTEFEKWYKNFRTPGYGFV